MKRKTLRLIALSLCVVLMAAAVVDTAPVSAYAVTQTEIDALKAERDAIKAQRQEKQAIVEQLEADKASVVEQKQAMDERNMYTLQQIQLNSDEIALYDEMIADKEKELTEAQRLEDEQLERYRARVRAMEENGLVNRKVYAEVPPRVEYSLTELGKSLKPILDSMWAWGEAYQSKQ